ncbi:TetR/AcrR family transcriptional regulator [Nisaea nitritireducens]|uniref:TetR/AcrR family transcriptional regulator n=1 Tax=Nisaea nitritireducens TaxID=568392 RepID=UPI0018664FD0|nr:TetR/AcrR family transcriptional regulator [Nisaea nitritireducens]
MVGRPRSIDREAVLDAAQAVAARDGAGQLTLESVAAEAGISKASVLYDYKTKQALLKALVERRIATESNRIEGIEQHLGPVPNVAIRARLSSELQELSDEDRKVALGLCAVVSQDADLRRPVQDMFTQRIAHLMETSEKPRGPLLAFLAVEGLKSLEWLGLYKWPSEERKRLLSEIRWLVDQEPEERACDEVTDSP